MYVIGVTILARTGVYAPEILSYFFDQPIEPGNIVIVPFRNKDTRAMVTQCTPLQNNKLEIKRSGFSLKKIVSITDERPISNYYIQIANWLTGYYFSSLGLCLKTVLPKYFGVKKYPILEPGRIFENVDFHRPVTPSVRIWNAKDIHDKIIPHIYKAIDLSKQVLILTPDTIVASRLKSNIDSQIKSEYLHSGLQNTDIHKAHSNIAHGDARLIIGTRMSLFAPYANLGLIIIEDPQNEIYKSDMSPYYNAVDLAKQIAIIWGASVLHITQSESVSDFAPHEHENNVQITRELPNIEISDTVQEMRKGNFTMFSFKTQKAIQEAISKNQRILIYSGRKAYSGLLLCKNCGAVAKCQNCHIPQRVHKTPATREFPNAEWMLVCYHCSAYRQMPQSCPNCSAKPLSFAGVAGSQKIRESLAILLKKISPSFSMPMIMDSDLVKDDDSKREIIANLRKAKYPILIATQQILSFRHEINFDLVVVANADSLMSARDFRTQERFISQISKLSDFSPKTIILQTYNSDDAVFNSIKDKNFEDLYRDEIEQRRKFILPPFCRIFKLRYSNPSHQKASIEAKEMTQRLRILIAREKLEKSISIMGPAPSMINKVGGKYSYTVILKFSTTFKHISEILAYLSPQWHIEPDPNDMT